MTSTIPLRILFLGPSDSPILEHLRGLSENVRATTEPIDADVVKRLETSLVISHGYRHILRPATLAILPHRFLNLHISLLPWNRGADPNLWSFLEDTPKGISIHEIDKGVDTGDVLAQREVWLDTRGTLATTYQELQTAMLQLFSDTWPAIRSGTIQPQPQETGGSTHKRKDKDPYLPLLRHGWHTNVSELVGKALP